MKGYSVVNLKNEDGSYTQGFRKLKSSLDNWEKTRDEQEEIYEQLLQGALRDIGEVTWWDRYMNGIETPMQKLVHLGGARHSSKFSKQQRRDSDENLQFIRDKREYNVLRNLIKNGEQFMLDDQLCSFVNSYSTYKPKGDK